MREKRGQAAMEFLMTYGWAILAAVIVIGVLASFGVFSPESYVAQSCSLTAPLGCVDNQVSAAPGWVAFVATNGLGTDINITSVTVIGCGTSTTATPLADGAESIINITCSPVLSTGKFNGGVTLTYRTLDGLIDQTSSGSVTVDVV